MEGKHFSVAAQPPVGHQLRFAITCAVKLVDADIDHCRAVAKPGGKEILAFGLCYFYKKEVTHTLIKGLGPEVVAGGAHFALLKYWLEVSSEEQEKRFKARIKRPDKQWKLSDMDLEARRRWYAYSRARDRMLDASDTDDSPWYIVPSDDKQAAHLNCISHLLNQVPYEPLGTAIVTLPKPDETEAYDDQKSMKSRRFVPDNC